MTKNIGLLIVHGIGHQRRGELAREMAGRLTDAGIEENNLIHRITVQEVPVHVTEAYWADISDPDNVPELRVDSRVIPEFLDTVSAAWYSLFPGSSSREPDSKRARHYFMLVGISAIIATLVIGILITTFSLGTVVVWFSNALPYTGLLIGMLIVYYIYHYTRDAMRKKLIGIPIEQRVRRGVLKVLWLPVLIIRGYLKFILLYMLIILSAEFLLFLFITYLVLVPVNYLFLFPVLVIQDTSEFLKLIKWECLRRWLHRLTWVMIILPMQSLMQSVKIVGNLFSILFTGRQSVVRAAALAWLPGLYLGFIILMVLCELLILPGIMIFLPDNDGPKPSNAQSSIVEIMIFSAIWMLFYLGYLKLMLPVVDLALDISNYHLADDTERRSYVRPIEAGVANLVRSGVDEIHILAHSLGSVITYDWLQSRASSSVPVTVLHTIGSPLDKFWYFDHSRQRRQADGEGLSIKRLRTWDNYWAWSDLIVSGSLNHYALSKQSIVNHRLRWLGPFVLSHVAYWKNKTVIEGLRTRFLD